MEVEFYNVKGLTEEEYEVAMKAIQKIREKNARLEMTRQAKKILDDGISMMIDLVGIEQTKTLLRQKNQELRK